MKVFTVLSGMAFFILVLTLSSFAETRYVEIKKPFASVYEYLDPKSQILVQATKKDHFELVYEGTSWYQVKVKGIFFNNYGNDRKYNDSREYGPVLVMEFNPVECLNDQYKKYTKKRSDHCKNIEYRAKFHYFQVRIYSLPDYGTG